MENSWKIGEKKKKKRFSLYFFFVRSVFRFSLATPYFEQLFTFKPKNFAQNPLCEKFPLTFSVKTHTTLSFLSLFSWKKGGKTKKTRIFYPYRTPKTPGREGKNAQKNKEILARRKTRNSKKTKERKDRAVRTNPSISC